MKNNKSNKSNKFKIILFYAALIIGVFVVISLLFNDADAEPIEYSDVVHYFESDAVVEFTVDKKDYLVMKVYDGELSYDEEGKITNSTKTVGYQLDSVDNFREECSAYYMKPAGETNLEKFNFEPIDVAPWWVTLLPYAFVIILMIVLWFVFSSQAEKGGAGKINSFGKARVKVPTDDKNKVYFKDVAGADEEKEELREVVDFLKDPEKFAKLGAKIPHGVLLVGPPGTGKTLLAKAVAGEAGVPFFSISGSDFVEMYVGVGASRVRDLFENARKAPASIIFIDEIDAVGRHRGAGLGGGHDEREQTLNQLLVEMDGFGSHEGIIVIAATNRPDILDPALLRPGRFDRQITVNYPDIKGREEILKVHAKNKPLEEGVDLETVAKTTAGFTGADLANLLNEAALLASRRGKSLIGMEVIEDAFIKVIAGPKKKSRVMKAREKRITVLFQSLGRTGKEDSLLTLPWKGGIILKNRIAHLCFGIPFSQAAQHSTGVDHPLLRRRQMPTRGAMADRSRICIRPKMISVIGGVQRRPHAPCSPGDILHRLSCRGAKIGVCRPFSPLVHPKPIGMHAKERPWQKGRSGMRPVFHLNARIFQLQHRLMIPPKLHVSAEPFQSQHASLLRLRPQDHQRDPFCPQALR